MPALRIEAAAPEQGVALVQGVEHAHREALRVLVAGEAGCERHRSGVDHVEPGHLFRHLRRVGIEDKTVGECDGESEGALGGEREAR